MKIDEKKDAVPDSVSAGDQQNRREFFNGLGKWSMIVVAAVSFLRGSATRSMPVAREHKDPNGNRQRTGVSTACEETASSTRRSDRVVTITPHMGMLPT